jgi:hypothetical protein
MDYLIRFVAGGVLVSLFAMVGDVLRPKSFAGITHASSDLKASSPSGGIGLTRPAGRRTGPRSKTRTLQLRRG